MIYHVSYSYRYSHGPDQEDCIPVESDHSGNVMLIAYIYLRKCFEPTSLEFLLISSITIYKPSKMNYDRELKTPALQYIRHAGFNKKIVRECELV